MDFKFITCVPEKRHLVELVFALCHFEDQLISVFFFYPFDSSKIRFFFLGFNPFFPLLTSSKFDISTFDQLSPLKVLFLQFPSA